MKENCLAIARQLTFSFIGMGNLPTTARGCPFCCKNKHGIA
jgi:hypothetical protein